MNNNYISYLDLPKIPDSILNSLPRKLEDYVPKRNYFTFHWSESHNIELDKWCKENISKDLYYAFMLTNGDLLLHKDVGTITKLNYIIDAGGDQVYTKFYNEDKKLVREYVIEPHRWHLLKSDSYHSVNGIAKNQLRFSVTAKIF